MMTDPSSKVYAAGAHFQSPSCLEDDDTVATPPKGKKSTPSKATAEEKTLKFRFPPTSGNDVNVNPLVLRVHWMYEVQSAFGDDVFFVDNNNRKVGKIDPLRTPTESNLHSFNVHVAHFKNRSNDGSHEQSRDAQQNPTRFIIHRIQSKFTLSEIKNTPNVANLMRKYNFYVNDHQWSEVDWDTTQLGFFYGLDPQFYDSDHAMYKIQENLKKNAPRTKVPKFRLVYCSPKVRKKTATIALFVRKRTRSKHSIRTETK
jgi:hypothetical protein